MNLDTLEALDAAEVDPGVLRSHGLVAKRGPGQDPRPRRGLEGAHRAGARLLAERDPGHRGRRRPHRDHPRALGRRPSAGPRERTDQPVSCGPRFEEAAGGSPPCCPGCGTCSGCPTCATRSSSRSRSSRSTASARTCRSPTSTSTRSRTCRTRPNNSGVVGLPRPLLRRRDHQRRHLLPRDHAVHHGVDHHAAPRRRDPEARAVAEGGPGRAEEDHAVDPLRHHRPGGRSSPPGSCSRCTRARAACSASPGFQGPT